MHLIVSVQRTFTTEPWAAYNPFSTLPANSSGNFTDLLTTTSMLSLKLSGFNEICSLLECVLLVLTLLDFDFLP